MWEDRVGDSSCGQLADTHPYLEMNKTKQNTKKEKRKKKKKKKKVNIQLLPSPTIRNDLHPTIPPRTLDRPIIKTNPALHARIPKQRAVRVIPMLADLVARPEMVPR